MLLLINPFCIWFHFPLTAVALILFSFCNLFLTLYSVETRLMGLQLPRVLCFLSSWNIAPFSQPWHAYSEVDGYAANLCSQNRCFLRQLWKKYPTNIKVRWWAPALLLQSFSMFAFALIHQLTVLHPFFYPLLPPFPALSFLLRNDTWQL